MTDLAAAIRQSEEALVVDDSDATDTEAVCALGAALRSLLAAAREAEAALAEERPGVREAFVAGVAWHEYDETGATIWTSDRRRAEEEAERRYPTSGWIESPRLTAAEGRVRELEAFLHESNAVCACGCPESAHESYGEDGESCGVAGHDCVRTSRSVAGMLAEERRRREEAKEMLRVVAAEGCRDKPGSGVSCGEAAIPPADRCEVCRVIEWLAAHRTAPPQPAPMPEAVREAAERLRGTVVSIVASPDAPPYLWLALLGDARGMVDALDAALKQPAPMPVRAPTIPDGDLAFDSIDYARAVTSDANHHDRDEFSACALDVLRSVLAAHDRLRERHDTLFRRYAEMLAKPAPMPCSAETIEGEPGHESCSVCGHPFPNMTRNADVARLSHALLRYEPYPRCEYENSCDDSGRDPACRPCETRAALDAAQKGKP